jgi:hypothetical protein
VLRAAAYFHHRAAALRPPVPRVLSGGEVRVNRSTYRVKPFYLSSETVLPIKPFYLSKATCAATPRQSCAGLGTRCPRWGPRCTLTPPDPQLNGAPGFKPITYNLSSENSGFKTCLSNATCAATPRRTSTWTQPRCGGASRTLLLTHSLKATGSKPSPLE